MCSPYLAPAAACLYLRKGLEHALNLLLLSLGEDCLVALLQCVDVEQGILSFIYFVTKVRGRLKRMHGNQNFGTTSQQGLKFKHKIIAG